MTLVRPGRRTSPGVRCSPVPRSRVRPAPDSRVRHRPGPAYGAAMVAPSGRQHLLVGPTGQRAVVVEVGGGLREYTIGEEPVLDGYPEDQMCASGRGQPLLPWPNRVGDGRYNWDDQTLQLPLSEPERHNASHGLVRWASWSAVASTTDRVTMAYRLLPQPGWLWALDLRLDYALGDAGLTVTVHAENLGDRPCPWGAGFHPYLFAFDGLVDDLVLVAPGATAYRSDDRGLPLGTEPVAGGELDFRAGRRVGDARLDVAFTDLERDAEGRAEVEIRHGEGSERTRLWLDRSWTHLMVFTGDTLGDVGRRRRGLAIEPMTAAPDMLRSGDGRIVLAPGERWAATWGITPGLLT
jgi:aldose 1-epimerase